MYGFWFPIYDLKCAADTRCVRCDKFEKVRPSGNYRSGSRAISRNSLFISRRYNAVCQIDKVLNWTAMPPVWSLNAPLGGLCKERIARQRIYRSAKLKIGR